MIWPANSLAKLQEWAHYSCLSCVTAVLVSQEKNIEFPELGVQRKCHEMSNFKYMKCIWWYMIDPNFQGLPEFGSIIYNPVHFMYLKFDIL